MRTDEIVSSTVGESRANIHRYIRLTKLIPELLVKVDANEIAIGVGENLSYLSDEAQELVLDCIKLLNCKISIDKAQAIKKYCENNSSDVDRNEIRDILIPPPANPTPKPIKIKPSSIQEYIPKNVQDAEEFIIEALAYYKETHQFELDYK